MGDKSQNIPLNARIVAKNGNSFMYQTPGGDRFVYNSTSDIFRKAEASDEIQLKSVSVTEFGGHNSEWATNAITSYRGKSLDNWWKQPNGQINFKASKPKKETPEYPESEFFKWAKKWKPGDDLPAMPPGLSMKMCHNYGGGNPIDDMRFTELDDIIKYLPLPTDKFKIQYPRPVKNESEKGLLGRSLNDFSQSLLSIAANARGLYLDGKNKLRCGPGNPGANRFTNIFGIGCDIPGSPDGPDGSVGSATAKINNDKTPDVPRFRKLSAAISSMPSNIRPLRYDKNTLSLFDDNGSLIASGIDAPDDSPVGRMFLPIVSNTTRIIPRNESKERQARKKEKVVKPESYIRNIVKSWPGTGIQKAFEIYYRSNLDLEERVNARRKKNGLAEIRLDANYFEKASPVMINGVLEQFAIPDGAGGLRLLNQFEQDLLGYSPNVVQRLLRGGLSDSELRKARKEALEEQLGEPISNTKFREMEELVEKVLEKIAIHNHNPNAEFEDVPFIPLKIYWGSNDEMLEQDGIYDPNDEIKSGTLVFAMIPGQKNPFDRPDSIDPDSFADTFGIRSDGTSIVRNRSLASVQSEVLDNQLKDYLSSIMPGAPAADIDLALGQLKNNPNALRRVMSDLNPPAYGVLVLNPDLLRQENLWKFVNSAGDHNQVNGKAKTTDDYLQDLIDHELNHLNDFYNKIRTIANIDKDTWQEILATGQPLNFRTLANYDPNSILAEQLRRLDMRVAAARDDIEKVAAIMQWYMENYSFNEQIKKEYQKWAKKNNYSERKIQEVLDEIADRLGARGVRGDFSWWAEAFINSAGQQDPSFRTKPKDAVAEEEVWALIYNIIGTSYGQTSPIEAMAELGSFIFNGDGVKQIQRWLNSSENKNFSNYTESEIIEILGLFLGEERVQEAFKNPGKINPYEFKNLNVNVRNTALSLAPSKFHNYNNVKAQSISGFVGKSSIKALGGSIGTLRGMRIEPFRPNAYDGDNDGSVQDATIHERISSPVGAMRAATNTVTQDSFSPNTDNRRIRRNKIKKQKPEKRFSAVQSLSTIASERENPAGPIGKIEKYPLPRPVDNDWLYDIDALRQKIDEMETTVDSFFTTGKPKKLRHAINNIQNIVDAMNRSGVNVEVSPSYFIISSLNSLKEILGGRYSGPDTPISPAELGAYYALTHHLVEYPEAFRDVSLDFNSINMPDQPAVNAPGGMTGMLPTFMEFMLNRAGIGEQGVRINSSLPGLEGRMLVSEAGLDDLTQVGVSINPKLRRAKKAVMMALPSIPYNQGRNPEFFVPGIGPISLTLEEIPNGFVDSIINELLEMATNKKPSPDGIMDTTITTAVAQLSQEIANNYEEAMNLAKEKPALRNKIVSNATNKAIEGFDEILKVSTFLVGVHEFGHLLDQVGDWRNSTNASNKNYGKGLNSAREFRLAVAELSAIESGMSSPFMEDISDMYATKFVVDQVMDALQTKMAHDAMLRDVPKMIEQREELDAKIKTLGESISSSMSGISELNIRNSMDNALSSGSGIESVINSILSSIITPSQDESLEVLQSMRATLSMMDRQLAQAEEMMERFQTKLQNMVPILKWLNKQTFGFDRMHYLLTDILTGNKNAIDEFMQNFAGNIYGKRDWFDENGKFDKAKYVASVIDKVNDDGLYQQLLMYVNELMIKQNNNGWKNLSDEEISSISALLPYISIYAGPAYYPGTKPAKNYAASNAEGYAELHVAKMLESADSLAQFSEQEKNLLDRLHSEMIEWATGSNKGM